MRQAQSSTVSSLLKRYRCNWSLIVFIRIKISICRYVSRWCWWTKCWQFIAWWALPFREDSSLNRRYMNYVSTCSFTFLRFLSLSSISRKDIMTSSLDRSKSASIQCLNSANTNLARQFTPLTCILYGKLAACISTMWVRAFMRSFRSSLLSFTICLREDMSGRSAVASRIPKWCSIKLQGEIAEVTAWSRNLLSQLKSVNKTNSSFSYWWLLGSVRSDWAARLDVSKVLGIYYYSLRQ